MKNKRVSLGNSIETEQDELNRLLLENLAPIPLNASQNESLRQRITDRVAQSVAKQVGLLTVRCKGGVWHTLMAGIRVKQLWKGPQGSSVLIEFAPGASLLAHRHHWLEEGIVLWGDLQMGELNLGPFDYHVSPVGSRHGVIHSHHGALAYLRGTSLGDTSDIMLEVIGGLLPFGNDQSRTVFANNPDHWFAVGDGVRKKELWADDIRASCLYHLEPGARVPEHPHVVEEECMMLEGEMFLGDILLQAGDYHLAQAGSLHDDAYSDVGAMLFVRGARDY